MTPEWVVEKFLPDFETRYSAYSEKRYGISVIGIGHPDKYFVNKHFFKALLQLLKAQRDICADLVLDAENSGYCEVFTTERLVREAPIPEAKNN